MPFELGLWRRNAEQRIFGHGTDHTPGGPNNDRPTRLRVSLRRLLRTMSGELRKPRTLMRLRRWLGRLPANVSAEGNNGIAKHAWRCSMRRRWFAPIGFTALLFLSYHYRRL